MIVAAFAAGCSWLDGPKGDLPVLAGLVLLAIVLVVIEARKGWRL